jgi:hypothetical protein
MRTNNNPLWIHFLHIPEMLDDQLGCQSLLETRQRT